MREKLTRGRESEDHINRLICRTVSVYIYIKLKIKSETSLAMREATVYLAMGAEPSVDELIS